MEMLREEKKKERETCQRMKEEYRSRATTARVNVDIFRKMCKLRQKRKMRKRKKRNKKCKTPANT